MWDTLAAIAEVKGWCEQVLLVFVVFDENHLFVATGEGNGSSSSERVEGDFREHRPQGFRRLPHL